MSDSSPPKGPKVSIHARQYWRAMRQHLRIWATTHQFQSTPANTGGRCARPHAACGTEQRFQSTPANTGGRCASRHSPLAAPSRFNPRPPILAGDARRRWRHKQCRRCVSIHARQYWRAMPDRCSACKLRCVGFNPRPPILAGDARDRPQGHRIRCLFQSTPANTGGRCIGSTRAGFSACGFQSTPANTGGRCWR